jgi:hypothetical protein
LQQEIGLDRPIGNAKTYLTELVKPIKLQLHQHFQAECEVFLFGLGILQSMEVKYVEAFGDSLLVVQQVACSFQCFGESPTEYLDKCLDFIAYFAKF